MMTIRRIRYKDWFIQSWKCYSITRDARDEYFAWASREPSDDCLQAKGDVYFNYGDTELDAIELTKKELDNLASANKKAAHS